MKYECLLPEAADLVEVFEEQITEMADCKGMSPVVIWKISITFLDHQYKSTHKLE
jgi:hypothetical protein